MKRQCAMEFWNLYLLKILWLVRVQAPEGIVQHVQVYPALKYSTPDLNDILEV